MSGQTVSQILESLGVTLDVGPRDFVAGAVVLAKVVSPDDVAVVIASSEGMSWLDQYGLTAASLELIRSQQFGGDDT